MFSATTKYVLCLFALAATVGIGSTLLPAPTDGTVILTDSGPIREIKFDPEPTPFYYTMWEQTASYANMEKLLREHNRRVSPEWNLDIRGLILFKSPEYTVAIHGKKVVVTTTDPRLVRIRVAR